MWTKDYKIIYVLIEIHTITILKINETNLGIKEVNFILLKNCEM